jgi:hypothetical protein
LIKEFFWRFTTNLSKLNNNIDKKTRRKMPLVGYLDLVMNDVKQRLLKNKNKNNRLKAMTSIRIKRKMFKISIA